MPGSNAPGVLDHPSHFLGGALTGGDDEISLIFAVLVVHYDEELAGSKGCESVLDRVEGKGGLFWGIEDLGWTPWGDSILEGTGSGAWGG